MKVYKKMFSSIGNATEDGFAQTMQLSPRLNLALRWPEKEAVYVQVPLSIADASLRLLEDASRVVVEEEEECKLIRTTKPDKVIYITPVAGCKAVAFDRKNAEFELWGEDLNHMLAQQWGWEEQEEYLDDSEFWKKF